MARLRTIGFEANSIALGTNNEGTNLEGTPLVANAYTSVSTTVARSGTYALKCLCDGSNNGFVTIRLKSSEVALGRTYYFRAYVYLTSVSPSAALSLMELDSTVDCVSVRLSTSNKLQLWNDVASSQIGSDSSQALLANTWHRIELSLLLNAGATCAVTLNLNGSQVATASSLTLSGNVLTDFSVGFVSGTGLITSTMYVDDSAINDSTGSSQNSWPGDGRIVMLKPTSDNARTGFTAGAGATTSLFSAVSATPPVGLADASATNLSQVHDAASSTTDNYDAKVTSYAAAGIQSSDTVSLQQALCCHSEAIVTGTKAGALLIVSNPVQSAEDAFNYGDDTATVGGTFPTGWQTRWGTTQVGNISSANRTVAPVLRVGKRTATTRVVDVCFMGINVEYTNNLIPPLGYLGHPGLRATRRDKPVRRLGL